MHSVRRLQVTEVGWPQPPERPHAVSDQQAHPFAHAVPVFTFVCLTHAVCFTHAVPGNACLRPFTHAVPHLAFVRCLTDVVLDNALDPGVLLPLLEDVALDLDLGLGDSLSTLDIGDG